MCRHPHVITNMFFIVPEWNSCAGSLGNGHIDKSLVGLMTNFPRTMQTSNSGAGPFVVF